MGGRSSSEDYLVTEMVAPCSADGEHTVILPFVLFEIKYPVPFVVLVVGSVGMDTRYF